MHEHLKPRGTQAANRVHVTLAIALAAVAIAAGVALGHHPAGAQTAASVGHTVAMSPGQGGESTADPSVPAAADALRATPHESAEPTSTF